MIGNKIPLIDIPHDYLSVSLTVVVESHPDNALEDLRLDQPFTALKHHIESYDLDNMEKKVRLKMTTECCVFH